MQVKESVEELTAELISNRATTAAAAYYLLQARLARYVNLTLLLHILHHIPVHCRYNRQFQPRTRRVHKTKRVSRDQGFFEADEDDTKSTISCPTRSRRAVPPRPAAGIKVREHPYTPLQTLLACIQHALLSALDVL